MKSVAHKQRFYKIVLHMRNNRANQVREGRISLRLRGRLWFVYYECAIYSADCSNLELVLKV